MDLNDFYSEESDISMDSSSSRISGASYISDLSMSVASNSFDDSFSFDQYNVHLKAKRIPVHLLESIAQKVTLKTNIRLRKTSKTMASALDQASAKPFIMNKYLYLTTDNHNRLEYRIQDHVSIRKIKVEGTEAFSRMVISKMHLEIPTAFNKEDLDQMAANLKISLQTLRIRDRISYSRPSPQEIESSLKSFADFIERFKPIRLDIDSSSDVLGSISKSLHKETKKLNFTFQSNGIRLNDIIPFEEVTFDMPRAASFHVRGNMLIGDWANGRSLGRLRRLHFVGLNMDNKFATAGSEAATLIQESIRNSESCEIVFHRTSDDSHVYVLERIGKEKAVLLIDNDDFVPTELSCHFLLYDTSEERQQLIAKYASERVIDWSRLYIDEWTS